MGLLEVTPQVGLDVDDHEVGAGGGGDAAQQELVVRPVGAHRRRVAQVGEVLLLLGGAGRRRRLQQLVVAEHRDLVGGDRLAHVQRGERPVRVPRRPAVARVDAARQVLIPRVHVRLARQVGGVAGRVGDAEQQVVRPAQRQQRHRGQGREQRAAHRR